MNAVTAQPFRPRFMRHIACSLVLTLAIWKAMDFFPQISAATGNWYVAVATGFGGLAATVLLYVMDSRKA